MFMRPSTEYLKGKSEKEKEADCKPTNVTGTTHLLRAFLLYLSLIRITPIGTPTTISRLRCWNIVARLLAYSEHYTLGLQQKVLLHFPQQNGIATGVTGARRLAINRSTSG